MTDTPPSPFLHDAPESDQVGLAVRAIGAGVSFAVGWLGLITWGTLRIAGESGLVPAEQIDVNAAHVNLLVYGLTSGLAVTGLLAWWLLSPVSSTWRRWGITMVSVFAGVSFGMAATYLIRETGGQAGLLALGVVGFSLALVLGRAARRAA